MAELAGDAIVRHRGGDPGPSGATLDTCVPASRPRTRLMAAAGLPRPAGDRRLRTAPDGQARGDPRDVRPRPRRPAASVASPRTPVPRRPAPAMTPGEG